MLAIHEGDDGRRFDGKAMKTPCPDSRRTCPKTLEKRIRRATVTGEKSGNPNPKHQSFQGQVQWYTGACLPGLARVRPNTRGHNTRPNGQVFRLGFVLLPAFPIHRVARSISGNPVTVRCNTYISKPLRRRVREGIVMFGKHNAPCFPFCRSTISCVSSTCLVGQDTNESE